MYKLKKIALTILTMVSILAGSLAPMVAQAETTLPDETRSGSASITIHKYQIDSSFVGNENYVHTGKEIGDEVIGTQKNEQGVDEDVTISQLEPLRGVQFEVERVVPKRDSNGKIITPVTYEVDNSFAMQNVEILDNGIGVVSGLEFGIYKITELDSGAVEEVAEPFYLSVPHLNELTNEWIYDVHVYIKNRMSQPTIKKDVTQIDNQHDTMNYVDNVNWIIRSEIPADIAKSETYVVTDALHSALQYVNDSLELYFEESGSGNKIDLEEEDYVFGLNKNGKIAYPWQDVISVSLTEEGREKLARALPAEENEKAWLYMTFDTKVEMSMDDLEELLGEAIPNQAKLEYTNSLGVTFTPKTEEPEIHLGGVLLKKVDPNAIPLRGAKFKIYTSEEEAKKNENAMADPMNPNIDWVVTSDESGIVKFFGLSYGELGQEHDDPLAKTTYWIVEVEAPKDENGKSYNLLKEPLEVVVNRVSHETNNLITVVNTRFDLPLTGGNGTTLFVVGGALLMLIGVVGLFTVRKKQDN